MKPFSIVSLSLALLFSLSACQGDTNTPEQSAAENTTVQEQSIPEQDGQASPLNNPDQVAFESVVETGNSEFCDKINSATLKAQCLTELDDLSKLDAAVQAKDATLCSDLSTSEKQESCRIRVETVLELEKQQQQEEEKRQATAELMAEIIQSGEIEKCADLPTEGSRFDCESNIVIGKALQGDVSECEKATIPEVVERCQEVTQ